VVFLTDEDQGLLIGVSNKYFELEPHLGSYG